MQCLLPSNGLAGAGHEAGLSAAPAAEAEPAEAAEPRETLAARLRRQGWDGADGDKSYKNRDLNGKINENNL
jgi:hypothetical protein